MIPFLRQRGSAAHGPGVSWREPIEDQPYVNWNLPIEHPVLIMAVAMGVFLMAPALAERLRAPGLIGILVAGGIIGPNALNVLARDQTIVLLGTVGLLYLIFVAGISIDLHSYRHYRNRSLTFGTVSFLIPQVVGTGVFVMLGYGLAPSLLLGSMFGSHTLISYPIAVRFGISKNIAVTTAVGGTIITDTAALMVLAVVAASTRGALDAGFWLRLLLSLAVYTTSVWLILPRLGRWFFRHERTGATAEFVFMLTALFTGAFLAGAAGFQPIIGAFLVGLALNRLVPEQSVLMNRIHFVGESFFIPFFLLSVGMLIDLRILAGDVRAWQVMLAMIITVMLTKGGAAKVAQRMFGYSSAEGWAMVGLTVPQAAATLAVALVGLEVGLLDDVVLNGAIMMMLVTCLVGPWLMEKYGRQIALVEEQRPYDPADAPQRVLVPVSNPNTAEDLMDLALMIRARDSTEPVLPLAVVPADTDRSAEYVANAEKMLRHVVAYAKSAGARVIPLTRVDHNFASGIARGATETRASTLVVGWDGQRASRRGIFGTVLDQVLQQTKHQIIVAKLGHPLNTTERIVLLIPRGTDHVPGFPAAAGTVKLLANRLGARISGYTVGDPAATYLEQFESLKPTAPCTFDAAPDWPTTLRRLAANLRADDLVVVLGARRGSLAWVPALERLPGRLAGLGPESFLVIYPAEIVAPASVTVGETMLGAPR
jgi:Kef-type K+ transport system membrane component KefB/nucleotide-binding universal stress UspA family protein